MGLLLHGLSLAVVRGGGLLSAAVCRSFHCRGFSCCRVRAVGACASVIVAQGLSCSEVCGIFLDQGYLWGQCVPCIGRQIPHRWTTREAPNLPFLMGNEAYWLLVKAGKLGGQLLQYFDLHMLFLILFYLQYFFFSALPFLCKSEFLTCTIFLLSKELLLAFLARWVYCQQISLIFLRKSFFLLHF